mgnify:CR=1 FL=1
MNPFTWIRRLARDAFLAGVHDAVTEIAPADGQPMPSLADLQQRLALPGQPVEEPEPEPEPVKRRAK